MEPFSESLGSQIKKGYGVPASQNGGEYFTSFRRLCNICSICTAQLLWTVKVQRSSDKMKMISVNLEIVTG